MAPFATHTDVQTRLGRPLTTAEQAMADQVIGYVEGLIIEAVDRDQAWADALNPVPPTLKLLCVEKAASAVTNPTGVAAQSEQLGQYQHSETYPRASDIGVFLSDQERRRARRAVYGSNVASPRVPSIADDIFPPLIDPVTGWIQ